MVFKLLLTKQEYFLIMIIPPSSTEEKRGRADIRAFNGKPVVLRRLQKIARNHREDRFFDFDRKDVRFAEPQSRMLSEQEEPGSLTSNFSFFLFKNLIFFSAVRPAERGGQNCQKTLTVLHCK